MTTGMNPMTGMNPLPVNPTPTVITTTAVPGVPFMSQLREWSHSALAVIGILLSFQGVVSQYFTDQLGVPARILTAVFGGLGLLSVLGSKYVDSRNNAIVTAAAMRQPLQPMPPV